MSTNTFEINLTDSNFQQEVLESEIPCLVDFWAPWCMPCRMIAPAVEEIAEEYQGKLKVCKVNVDAAQTTAFDYNIMSIPTLAIFKNGKVADTIVGVVSKTKLKEMIDHHM
ncbi:MAG: thioredoxin [Coxiella sp. DG_40]|nr:MAG: thioredoxin [Coxiella sp. DG_40]